MRTTLRRVLYFVALAVNIYLWTWEPVVASLAAGLILQAMEDSEARSDYKGCMEARGYQEVPDSE